MNPAVDLPPDGSPPSSRKPLHAGLRTCVGCRARDERSALVHLVAQTAGGPPPRWQVVVDERGGLPGRGAWLHPRAECVERAIARKAFGRALRTPEPVDTTPLQEWWAMQDLETPPGVASQEKNRKRV